MNKLSLILLLLLFFSCNFPNVKKKNYSQSEFMANTGAISSVIIYKTKMNYNNNVPVILSEDKSQIVSYPDPKDLMVGNILLKPIHLENEYLLDKKGITKNVAFLKFTYEEYSKFQSLPSLKELYENIIDKSPLIELCDCGLTNTFDDVDNRINKLIIDNKLYAHCTKISLLINE